MKLPARQPALPADPADLERQRLLGEVDDLAVQNAKAIGQAIIAGAKSKPPNKTCAELYYKYLYNPVREEHAKQKQSQSQPLPLSIKLALYQSNQTLGYKDNVLEVTTAEFESLPPEKKAELGDKIVVRELFALTNGARQAVVEDPPPNHKCSDCGDAFYSAQKNVKRCRKCAHEQSLTKLLAHKKALQSAKGVHRVS